MSRRRLLVPLALCALFIAGCAQAKAPQAGPLDKAATVIPVVGTKEVQVHLSAEAVTRLAIQTDTVRDAQVAPRYAKSKAATMLRRVIPFAAVMYLPTGDAFAYAVAGPHLYQRAPLLVDYVDGDLAVLWSGPALGTSVVTVGGPELTGVEFGTGE